MTPPPGQDEGFSMIELMVVVLLMSIVLMGMFSLQDALLQQRGRILRNIMVRNQNDYARRIVMRELGSATLIQEPQVGATGNNLVAWKGLDPTNMYCRVATGVFRCDPCNPLNTNLRFSVPNSPNCGAIGATAQPLSSAPIEWFRFCLDSGNSSLVYYRGAGFAVDAVACGATPTPPAEMEVIAGYATSPGGVNVVKVFQAPGMLFSRGRSNWIDVNFSVNVEWKIPQTGMDDTAKAETHIGVAIMATNQPGMTW